MADRSELVEAALEVYRDGLVLLDGDDRVVFWNRAAEAMTGYPGAKVLGKQIPNSLEALTHGPICEADNNQGWSAGAIVHAQHLRGHDLPVIVRRIVLRDGFGERIGSAAVFHTTDQKMISPCVEDSEGADLTEEQSDLLERLELEHGVSGRGGTPLGVLWIRVDQAFELRKTHGTRACEAMLEAVERTLANYLIGGEELCRWSEDEFLLTARVTDDALGKRAQVLAGVARTADFRWWGDRISVTVSIGAAVADEHEAMPELLNRVRQAMEASVHAGGNHVTVAAGRLA